MDAWDTKEIICHFILFFTEIRRAWETWSLDLNNLDCKIRIPGQSLDCFGEIQIFRTIFQPFDTPFQRSQKYRIQIAVNPEFLALELITCKKIQV